MSSFPVGMVPTDEAAWGKAASSFIDTRDGAELHDCGQWTVDTTAVLWAGPLGFSRVRTAERTERQRIPQKDRQTAAVPWWTLSSFF